MSVSRRGISPRKFGIVGDLILSSGATVLFDVNRLGSDLVAILADSQNAGIVDLGGAAAFQLATQRVLPRSGQKFTILTAAGGLGGSTFDRAEGKGPLAIGAGLEGSVGRDDWRDDRAVANVSFAF